MKERTKRPLIILGIFFCLFMIIWGLYEDVKDNKETKAKVNDVTTIILGHDTIFKGIRSDIKTIRIDLDTVKHHLKISK